MEIQCVDILDAHTLVGVEIEFDAASRSLISLNAQCWYLEKDKDRKFASRTLYAQCWHLEKTQHRSSLLALERHLVEASMYMIQVFKIFSNSTNF